MKILINISEEAYNSIVNDYVSFTGTIEGQALSAISNGTVIEDDLIERKRTVYELRNALYKFEDEMEVKFQEDKKLNFSDWFQHRIFVQRMNDIDVETLNNQPYI